jgi:hypothetical protein
VTRDGKPVLHRLGEFLGVHPGVGDLDDFDQSFFAGFAEQFLVVVEYRRERLRGFPFRVLRR